MNLLIITIDSLRLDYVSRTNSLIRTPEFDRLAAGLLDFIPTCFSVSSATRPVHTSLFSGLYPFEHGIVNQRDGAIRAGTPSLLRLMQESGHATAAFSEAPEIFTGLDLGVPVQRLDERATRGTSQLFSWLRGCGGRSCCLFAHYWSTHAPYGATDGQAMGETARLLARGDVATVQERYRAVIAELFEHKLAPLLGRLDPFEWAIVVLGDHGESWTAQELYHGQTLHNAVLRVPLFVHLPRAGALPHLPIVSVVDLFPTLVVLFGLPVEYCGFGRDLRTAGARQDYCLAELVPLAPWHEDVQPMGGTAPRSGAEPAPPTRKLWALFDASRKFTFDERSDSGMLQETFTEQAIDDVGASEHFIATHARMLETSRYVCAPLQPQATGARSLIDERLRALGYLS